MSNVLKKGILGLGLCAFLAGVASCGPISSTSSDPAGNGASFSYQPYDTSVYGDPSQLTATVYFWHTLGQNNRGWLETLINEFNKIYPNIRIQASQQGSYDDIKTKIDRAIAAGGTELPTMAYCYPDHVADYIASGAVIPMDGFVDDETIGFTVEDGSHVEDGETVYGAGDFVQTYWNEGKAYQKEGLYSLPWTKSTELLFYNKDLFDQQGWTVPTTWEDMWNLCRIINEDWGSQVDGWYAPLGYDSDENMFITFCRQNDIPYTSNESDNRVLFNNDQAKSMVTTLKGYYDEGLFKTKGTGPNNTYTSSFFESGQVAMMISSSGGTSYANTPNFNVGVAPAPYSGEADYVSQGPSLCFFANSSWEQRYAAWLFYRFCTESTNSALIATSSTGYDPVRISSYETEYYLNWVDDQKDSLFGQASQVTEEIRDDTFFTPVFPGSATCRTEVGGILTNVLLGTRTVDQAFSEAYSRCIAAL